VRKFALLDDAGRHFFQSLSSPKILQYQKIGPPPVPRRD